MKIAFIAFSIFCVTQFSACASKPTRETEILNKIQIIFDQELYNDAIELSEQIAKSKNPDVIFSIAYLFVARSQLADRSSRQVAEDNRQILNFTQKAAILGSRDAAAELESAYKYGGFAAIKIDEKKSACWAAVVANTLRATQCVDQRK